MKTKLVQLLRAATLMALAAPITLATRTVIVAEAP